MRVRAALGSVCAILLTIYVASYAMLRPHRYKFEGWDPFWGNISDPGDPEFPLLEEYGDEVYYPLRLIDEEINGTHVRFSSPFSFNVGYRF